MNAIAIDIEQAIVPLIENDVGDVTHRHSGIFFVFIGTISRQIMNMMHNTPAAAILTLAFEIAHGGDVKNIALPSPLLFEI